MTLMIALPLTEINLSGLSIYNITEQNVFLWDFAFLPVNISVKNATRPTHAGGRWTTLTDWNTQERIQLKTTHACTSMPFIPFTETSCSPTVTKSDITEGNTYNKIALTVHTPGYKHFQRVSHTFWHTYSICENCCYNYRQPTQNLSVLISRFWTDFYGIKTWRLLYKIQDLTNKCHALFLSSPK